MSQHGARELVLASGSPRRRDLLESAGFRFRVDVPEVDESALPGEAPAGLVRRLALLKARAVARRWPEGACVLASDTVVVIDDQVLGKPQSPERAVEMLLRISGRTHTVYTGYAAIVRAEQREEAGVDASRVTLRPVGTDEALRYAASREPLDKAGGYAVQGQGGRFVTAIEGSRSNVIGLPLESVVPLLHALGVRPR
jgi:septum formation protein